MRMNLTPVGTATFILFCTFTGCSSNSDIVVSAAKPQASSGATSSSFSPSSVQFSIEESFPTQDVTLTKASAIRGPLLFTYSDPTVAGVVSDPISGSSANITFGGVAAGTTTATATDAFGLHASINLQAGPCGRPDEMTQNPILLSPANGASGIPTSVGMLYFAIYSVVPVSDVQLHMIVGQNQAFEAGTLQNTTLPAGTPTAAPAPGSYTLSYQAIAIPMLASDTIYRAQLHDNACSPALIAGTFSTGS